MSNKAPDTRKEWKSLVRHGKKAGRASDLFAQDADRFQSFHIAHNSVLFDYSKQNVTAKSIELLINLAKACDVEGWRGRLFAGDKINTSENRAVLHTALRDPKATPEIRATLARMRSLCERIRNNDITDVVNIGIGGSDLGPHMVCEALGGYADGPRVHFVSNVDGAHLARTLKNLKPKSTMFVVASKTFTTQETITNAQSAKHWAGDAKQFIAVTANEGAAQSFGIAPEHILPLWDWVGGRYSLWSAIGLSIAISTGFENFEKLLAGAHEADQHFKNAPLEANIPVMMGLLGIWHRNFGGASAFAVLPYAQDLHLLPAWLQQLDMESNGKSYNRDQRRVSYKTSPVVFGGPGTGGQHAFYQMLHQGTDIIPADFIGFANIPGSESPHQEQLLANALGQSQSLMEGQKSAQAWNIFEGGRPSSTLMLPLLDPYYLGMLLALYEHKIFVQGVIWNLNSFDQWGVELGKTVSKNILSALQGDKISADSSTLGLLKYIARSEE